VDDFSEEPAFRVGEDGGMGNCSKSCFGYYHYPGKAAEKEL